MGISGLGLTREDPVQLSGSKVSTVVATMEHQGRQLGLSKTRLRALELTGQALPPNLTCSSSALASAEIFDWVMYGDIRTAACGSMIPMKRKISRRLMV
jgi:hypothetical protein